MTTRIDAALLVTNTRLADVIVDAIDKYPQHVAFVEQDGASITYRELGVRISQALGVMKNLGLCPGDVVAQLSGNRIDMFCLMAAAYIGGYCSVTLHAMAGVDDHAAILVDSRAKLVVHERYYSQRAQELRLRNPEVSFWRSHDCEDCHPHFWSDAQMNSNIPLAVVGESEDIIRLAYTGGTTGRPKGVMLSNRSLLTNTRLWLAGLHWGSDAKTLCSAPISHGAGSLIYPTLVCGGTVYLQRGFTVSGWSDAVERHRIEYTFIVPTMLYALLDDPLTHQCNFGSLKALIYGAAPASPARIREALQRFGPVLVQTYGQTEAPNTILLLDQQAHARANDDQLAAAGCPFPGVEVVLCSEDGQPVAKGETGEICLRGELLMSGYHEQPEQTESVMRLGLLHTGDLARMASDGLFYIVDRKKDMIITGGFNVYPREVEDVLSSHPDVVAVAVIGVPDSKWGEAVKAVVVPRAGSDAKPEALIEYVRLRKGAVCTPKSIDFVEQVPLTSLGKPDKKALRSLYRSNPTGEVV